MKTPYEVLGMKETASADEIKKRYDILLRKYRAWKMNPEQGPLDFDLDEATAAYNTLMGYDIKAEDPNANRKRPILRMLGIDPGKFDNFWLYNKVKILVGVIVLTMVISFIVSAVNNVPVDFYIKVIGRFYVSEEAQNESVSKVNATLSAVENTYIDSSFVGGSEDPTYEMAMMQKFMVEITTRELDIVICDREKFDFYLNQGIFMDLRDIIPQNILDENEEYYFTGEIVQEEKIEGYFGINIFGNEFFKDYLSLDGKEEIIFTIVVNTERLESIKEFIAIYILE